jgi:hypothetical protein
MDLDGDDSYRSRKGGVYDSPLEMNGERAGVQCIEFGAWPAPRLGGDVA